MERFFTFFLLIFSVLLSSEMSVACGVPKPSGSEAGVYIGKTTQSAAFEGCVSLSDFVGKSIEVSVVDAPNVTVQMLGVILSSRPQIVSVLEGGETIRAKAEKWSAVQSVLNLPVRIRIVQSKNSGHTLPASWVFRGGQGSEETAAILTDGTSDIIRISCISDMEMASKKRHLGELSLHRDFGPELLLTGGERLAWFTPGSHIYDTKSGEARYRQGYHGIGRMGSTSLIPMEKRFVGARALELGGRLVENQNAAQALRHLKISCPTGVVFGPHPGEDCTLVRGDYQRLACSDADVGALARKIADRYAMLTALVPLDEVIPLWNKYSNVIEKREACGLDKACSLAAMQNLLESYQTLLGQEVSDAFVDQEAPNFSELPLLSSEFRADLEQYGFQKNVLDNSRILLKTPVETYLLTLDPQNRDHTELSVVHKMSSPEDLEREIDPSDQRYLHIAGKVAAPVIAKEIAFSRKKNRRPSFSISVPILHFVSGGRNGSTVEFGSGEVPEAKPVVRARVDMGGWLLPDGNVVSTTAFSDGFSEMQSLSSVLEREERAKLYDQKMADQYAQERKEKKLAAYERELKKAQDANKIGYIYKSSDFWKKFTKPELVASIFHANSQASDDMILGWVSAFDERCRSFLPDDYVVHKWQSPAGETKEYRYPFIISRTKYVNNELRVDRRLSAAVERAQASPITALSIIGAMRLSSGMMPDWDAISRAASAISQPKDDSLLLISIGGCDGALTKQYLANIIASTGNGKSVKDAPIVSISEAIALSDQPPEKL